MITPSEPGRALVNGFWTILNSEVHIADYRFFS